MKKVIWRFRFDQLREPVFLIVVGVSLIITLNQPNQLKVNNPKTYKPVVMTEKVVEKEPVHYLTDEDFSRLYTLISDVKNDLCLDLTVEDAIKLMKIAICEGGDDVKAQCLIMRVILNRLASDAFPNSIDEIIHQYKQFSTVQNGRYDKAEPTSNSHIALGLIEGGWDESQGALYFEASFLKDSWQSKNREFLFEYAGTRYYR